MGFDTPVALFIFNRPQFTARVFETIAAVRPKKLFLAADGPRSAAEEPLCRATRAVVERVDWECEVFRDYSDVNLGCGRRESSAFDWVFSHVEEAVLLEDDTLPHPCFFAYCEELLDRYRHDTRVMHISGDNFQFGRQRNEYSYYFSKYPHNWGWATWRRAWKHYDFSMERWPEFRRNGLLDAVCGDPVERSHFTTLFDKAYADPLKGDTYDTQWLLACWSQGGVAALPSINLVSNLGFSDSATHTRGSARWANLPTGEIGPLRHPPFLLRDSRADRATFDTLFYGRIRRQNSLRRRLSAWTPDLLRRVYRRLRPLGS